MTTTMTTTMMRRRQTFDMFLTTKSIYEASVHKLHTGWLYNAKRYNAKRNVRTPYTMEEILCGHPALWGIFCPETLHYASAASSAALIAL